MAQWLYVLDAMQIYDDSVMTEREDELQNELVFVRVRLNLMNCYKQWE